MLASAFLFLTLLVNCSGFCPLTNPLSAAGVQGCSNGATACSSDAVIPNPVFPTDNQARAVNGRELHELLSASSEQTNSSWRGGLVILFYLAGDPPSVAVTPVFRCLAAFFPDEVQFVTVAYSELSLMALMSQGLHALPVLQVNAQGRRYRYSGKHWLGPMVHFVSRALAREPVASLDVAYFCSREAQLRRAQSGALEVCGLPSLRDAFVASRPALSAAEGRCDIHSTCRKVWDCSRWDGEATLEELRSQQPAPLFYISLAFLVLRALWFLKRKSARAHTAAAAAPAPEQGAVPAAHPQQLDGQAQQPAAAADPGIGG